MAGIGHLLLVSGKKYKQHHRVQTGGTRGIIGGGTLGDGTKLTSIRYVTISTTGDSIDFGDLQQHSGGGGLRGVASELVVFLWEDLLIHQWKIRWSL